MILNYNKIGIFALLYTIAFCSCRPDKLQTNCDKQYVIQKCLNILSADEHQYQHITMISNEITGNNIRLQWLNSPVKFEKSDISNIRKLSQSGKLYFMVSKFVCLENKTEISIICINANLKYDFELHKRDQGKEVLSIVQETDDALPFR